MSLGEEEEGDEEREGQMWEDGRGEPLLRSPSYPVASIYSSTQVSSMPKGP